MIAHSDIGAVSLLQGRDIRVLRGFGEELRRNPVPVGSYNVQAAAAASSRPPSDTAR